MVDSALAVATINAKKSLVLQCPVDLIVIAPFCPEKIKSSKIYVFSGITSHSQRCDPST